MSADPGDLANLADLALPPPVSFWPPAIGVWIVAIAAFAAFAVFCRHALMRYRADAYLRRAAAEIDALAEPSAPDVVSAILKRAAMVGYGRERVASLTGTHWTAFLAASAPPGETFAFSSDSAKAWLRHQRGRATREA
jgi:hypothetical protein